MTDRTPYLSVNEGCFIVPLTRGLVSRVSTESIHLVSSHLWIADGVNGKMYAMRFAPRVNGRQRKIRMHNVLIDVPDGMEVDHINGDSLDNRLENLRTCSHAENMRNQRIRIGGTSKYKGVKKHPKTGLYISSIQHNGNVHYLGTYNNEIAAACAYDQASLILQGEYSSNNFSLGLLASINVLDLPYIESFQVHKHTSTKKSLRERLHQIEME